MTTSHHSFGTGFWPWAKSWLLTTNHKRIGILYLWTTFTWFLFAGLDAMAIRAELITPQINLWKPDVYNGLFTYHGAQMVFLFAIPVFTAFGNIFIPPMVGARDMAFPKLNALAFWLVFFSGAVLRVPLVLRQFATAGWTNYVPMTNEVFSPGFGEDWWIWAILLETVSATMAGLNFLVTTIRARRPEIRPMKWRPFVWGIETTSVLAVVAGPFLILALIMLFMDRYLATEFFAVSLPGGSLLWQHIFWFYSHPATYIMILPAFGIISEVVPAFSGRPLFSYKAMLFGLWGTTIFGMLVWWHHMFNTGMEAWYSMFAMIFTFAVSVPTGVLFLNLLATMRGGRVRFTSAMLFALAVMGLFTIGGIDGVYMAVVPVDAQLHASYWLIAHIHFVLFGGTLMGAFAATYYWFPQMFGRRLSERWGKVHFWGSVTGAMVAFLPMHTLGAMGMVRRFWEYDSSFFTLNAVISMGAFLMGAAQFVFLGNVLVTLMRDPRPDDKAWPEPPTRRVEPELTMKDSVAVPEG